MTHSRQNSSLLVHLGGQLGDGLVVRDVEHRSVAPGVEDCVKVTEINKNLVTKYFIKLWHKLPLKTTQLT